ncbi:MAG: sigma-70 family RNA polymerase sigma factor [Phycisphaerales bacterium]|nr:MAG: sigma-70 family RNA polymerase sigma factor [Phycisphaerales bacterium]
MDEHDVGFLLKRVRQGDTNALATLCERFYPQVLKYMYYRVDAESAEDLTEEVFLRVLRHIGQQNGSFVAWLYRIAANIVADHARTKKTRQEGSTVEQLTELPVDGAEGGADTIGWRIDIHNAIVRLTDDQRELITLKFIQGLSNTDVAEITGRSTGAIRGLQFRALCALRLILESGKQAHEH